MLQIQLSDNVKSRIINDGEVNRYKPAFGPAVRSQEKIYQYFAEKLKESNNNI